jgi:hypothetical protein
MAPNPVLALAATLGALAAAAPAGADIVVHQPDISGVWGHAFPRPGQKVDPRLDVGPLPTPPLKPAYMAQWTAMREKEKEADEKGEPTAGLEARCLPDGMPSLMFAIYPLEILQTPGRVTLIEEAFSQTRRIYLDEKQVALDDAEPGYYGHSVGHWEGDTLVVDTIGLKESVPGYRDIPHSDEERITERIRLIDPDILEDRMTVDDPKMLEHPWSFRFVYRRMKGYHMLEYVCENNRETTDANGGTHLQLDGK